MPLITAHNRISLSDIGSFFARRQYDYTFGRNYSDLTPTLIEDCINRVKNGHWEPFVVDGAGHELAWHYLHDRQAELGTTWVSGYLMDGRYSPRGRGRVAELVKQALWEAARQYIVREEGFPHIFAYCMDVNTEGKRWAVDCCQLTVVGTMEHAVPEAGGMAAIEVYTQVPSGAGECRRQAEQMFPEGRWVT